MSQKSDNSELVDTFCEGDFVVYPAHGVGHVLGTEKREIGGSLLELVIVRFEHDKMTLRIPLSKAARSGLRKLSSKKQMDEAIFVLRNILSKAVHLFKRLFSSACVPENPSARQPICDQKNRIIPIRYAN